jgi:thiol-disulfide isomerase/thioredoxin
MISASLLFALIVTTAADTSGEPRLLDFHASWCGPCRQMRPEVDKLVRKGYPVESVDIDRAPQKAGRYKVSAVPTFVIVDGSGKELARETGLTPATRLASLYNECKAKLASVEPPPADAAEGTPIANDEEVPNVSSELEPTAESAETPQPVVNPKPWETVVRIKIQVSDREWGFGSGTVISSNARESIILTCAHIFRLHGRQQPQPKDFRAPIKVDLFNGQLTSSQPPRVLRAEQDIPGEALDYDFVNDVGLIRIRPGRRLPASRVVPPDWTPQRGMVMYSVGCSHGSDATPWNTQILDPKVGMTNTGTKQTFATMKCLHQPMEGRSGGGLYTTNGYVAGVCDFADPNEHVGLYAVPQAIHKLLDKNNLMALYRRDSGESGRMLAQNGNRARRASTTPGTIARAQSPSDSDLDRDAITLPRPELLKIPVPKVAASARRTPSATQTASRSTRRPEPLDTDTFLDPGAPTPRGEAVPTDLGIKPTPDELADARNSRNASVGNDEDVAPPTSSTRPSKWKPATRALPDLTGAGRIRGE